MAMEPTARIDPADMFRVFGGKPVALTSVLPRARVKWWPAKAGLEPAFDFR